MRASRIIASTLLALLSHHANAFPSGPGNCPLGQAAVTGHIAAVPNAITGQLASQGFSFVVNGKPVAQGGSVALTVNVTHNIAIATSGISFKGYLIRVNVIPSAISAGTNSGNATACATPGVAGIGHTNRNAKTFASGTLTLSQIQSGIAVDVTVVVQFNISAGINEYYYSSFTLNAVAPPVAPTPVAAPITPVAPVKPKKSMAPKTPKTPTPPKAPKSPKST